MENGLKNRCLSFINEEKARIIISFSAVFIFGLIAHAYGYFNLTVSHDSLFEFYASKDIIFQKISVGRFLAPLYQYVFHSRVTLPWLNGFLSLLWLSVCVWMTARIFSVNDKLRTVFIAGIFTINISVTAMTATYIHDLDADLFAAMLAVIAVYCWKSKGKTCLLFIV